MKKAAPRLKTPDEIRRIAESGAVLGMIFRTIESSVVPGTSTWEIDSCIEDLITRSGARAAFKTLPGWGFASCISINDEAVHGIPSRKKIIRPGDLVKVDTGVALNGYFTDACRTFPVHPVSDEAQHLVRACERALSAGIEAATPGRHSGDIGHAVESEASMSGFSIARNFSGHGTGFALHEAPVIPHWGNPGTGDRLLEGMVIAIEPLLCAGSGKISLKKGNWTAHTSDGCLCAQFEQTIAITVNGPLILTRW